MNYHIEDILITGVLVGEIWMPQTKCFKNFAYNATDAEALNASDEGMTLRDHVLKATNDGDFQHCKVADGVLSVTVRKFQGDRTYERTRHFDLSIFPSISDMIEEDFEYPDFMFDEAI